MVTERQGDSMHRIHPRRGRLALITAALCGLAGCGTSVSPTIATIPAPGAGPLSGCSGSITVASDLPTSGGDASIGGGTEKGVQLAISEARASHLLGTCDLEYVAMDDASAAKGKHDPAQGAQNIQQLAANPAVLGVVGPFNSGVAVAELAIANRAGLAMISPSNTDPGLTIPDSDPVIDTRALQPSGHITYYRVVSNDVVQAQVMAEFAVTTRRLRSVYVIDDRDTYGTDLANYFEQSFTRAGGTVVKRTGLPADTRDFRGALTEARSLGADAVFFGGVASDGSGLVSAQMKEVGLAATFLSGDGSVDPQYFIDGGVSGDGGNNKAYASSAPDATDLPSAGSFNALYTRTFSQQPVAYSAYGYDCMSILLDAIRRVLLAHGGTRISDPAAFRDAVVAQIGREDWKGTIGETRFDARGDTLHRAFTIYQATGGSWVGLQTVTAKGG
jgi:branched-chain amino acid transport system substrate-binding protein